LELETWLPYLRRSKYSQSCWGSIIQKILYSNRGAKKIIGNQLENIAETYSLVHKRV
jgi:hypothetical protein